jgi:TonB-dependent receptor
MQSRPWTAFDTKKGVNSTYSHDFAQFNVPIKIQAGIAYDDVTRFIRRLDLRGVFPGITGSDIAALADTGYNKDVAYGFGTYQALDPFKVWDRFGSRLLAVAVDDVREINEDNLAEFLRIDATIASDLLLTGGVRAETHKTSAYSHSRANARSKRTDVDLEYTELYPSLSAKYTPRANRNLVFRAGLSRTVGHPDYADILPTVLGEVNPGDRNGTINVPDPDLKPYFAVNYDLSVDYYFKHSGVVSIYGYRKDVKNYFISQSMNATQRDAFATEYGFNPIEFSAGSGAVTTNGGKSTLQGIELSYAQNLSFLPKPFNGLSVQTNFTYLDVKAKDPNPTRALDLEYSQMRAVSPKTANFILGYRYGDISFTSTTNWVSESLFGGFVATSFFTGAAGTATLPETRLARYRDEKTTTDMKVEYAINKNIAVYFLVRNVFNSQRIDYYRGYLPQYQDVVLADTRYEFGEPHLTLGLRGRF